MRFAWRLIGLSALCAFALAALIASRAPAAAQEEPGEGGMTTAEACEAYLKEYMGRSPGIKACNQDAVMFVLGKDSECSRALQRRFEEFGAARCKLGCAVPGELVKSQCNDASSNCSCMPVTNQCTKTIIVTYRRTGGKQAGLHKEQIGGRQTERHAFCTTERLENVTYVGWGYKP